MSYYRTIEKREKYFFKWKRIKGQKRETKRMQRGRHKWGIKGKNMMKKARRKQEKEKQGEIRGLNRTIVPALLLSWCVPSVLAGCKASGK